MYHADFTGRRKLPAQYFPLGATSFALSARKLEEGLAFSWDAAAVSISKRGGFQLHFALSSPLHGLLWSTSKM